MTPVKRESGRKEKKRKEKKGKGKGGTHIFGYATAVWGFKHLLRKKIRRKIIVTKLTFYTSIFRKR